MSTVLVPGLAIEKQNPDVLFRLCLWAEARGESVEGKLAVANVILNRAKARRWPIEKVILYSWKGTFHFTSFDPRDPNYFKLQQAHALSPLAYGECDAVAGLALKGLTDDNTMGATHYYNPAVVTPSWGLGHPTWQDRGMIGNHRFGVQT